MTDPLIAILTNDWHLWNRPPIFRSAEPDWLDTQAGYLEQISNLLPPAPSEVIVVMAGDMFDRADPPASFISWCMDHVPECYVVAGQHDLPNHRLQDIEKSGLGVLIKQNRCHLLKSNQPTYVNNLVLYGHSWKQEVEPLVKQQDDDRVHLAVIHAYIWTKSTCYEGASEDSRLRNWEPKLKGYTAAVFGDNHKAFFSTKNKACPILNNGTFMIRKSDERSHKPSVGLLHQSGKIVKHYLDVSKDKYLDVSGLESIISSTNELDTQELIKELESLGDQGLNFESAVNQYCESNKVNSRVRDLITKMMEPAK